MAFRPLGNSPGKDRVCDDVKSLLLKAFPAKELETHFRAGYSFRSDACTSAFAYDPDYCIIPGDVKMDPDGFGPERDATVGMLQSAFNCSPVGETLDTLRDIARQTLDNNLWRAIEADLVADLAAFPGIVVNATPLEATCALADAAQFLAVNGNCGKGIIVGPYDWFIQLGTDHLIWNGTYHTDVVGNIVIPLSVDNNTVYAFDSNVDIRITDILLMDELAPSIRSVNDRIVRAEQIYTIAIDPCVVGSFTVSACCACPTGGGGGGGGNVVVTNATGNVESTSTDDEALCDDNGIFFRRVVDDGEGNRIVSTVDVAGNPYAPVGTVGSCPTALSTPVIRTKHKMASDVNPWTPADATGVITSITYTILSGTANVTASDFQIVAGLPAGLTATWNNDNEGELLPLLSVNPQAPGDQTYVNWTELV